MIVTRGIGHGAMFSSIVAAGLCLGSMANIYTLPCDAFIIAIGKEIRSIQLNPDVRTVHQGELLENRTITLPIETRLVTITELDRLVKLSTEARSLKIQPETRLVKVEV